MKLSPILGALALAALVATGCSKDKGGAAPGPSGEPGTADPAVAGDTAGGAPTAPTTPPATAIAPTTPPAGDTPPGGAAPAPAGDLKARCEKVADHLLVIMRKEIPPDMKDEAEKQMGEQRVQIIEGCIKENITAEQETCIMAAQSIEQMAACEIAGGKHGEDDGHGHGDTPPGPATPADPDTMARCERIVSHVFTLMAKELPEEQKKEMLPQMEGEKRNLVEACTTEAVTAEQEKCALAATTMADLGKCSN